MYSNNIKQKAVDLRKKGNSYSIISKELKISKSVLSIWLRDIKYEPNSFVKDIISNAQKKIVSFRRIDKAKSIEDAINYSIERIKSITSDNLFFFGLAIYLGEGNKTDGITRIVNSDPRIIKFMISWFCKHFRLSENNFMVRVHIYPDNNETETIKYWSSYLKIKNESFYEVYVDKRPNKSKRKHNTLPYGTAHLCIRSNGDKNLGVLLQRKIIATIDRVLEGGISLVVE